MKLSSKALLVILVGASANLGVNARFEPKHKHRIFLKSTKPHKLPPAPPIESEPASTPSAASVAVVESYSAPQNPVQPTSPPSPKPGSNPDDGSCSAPDDSPILQTFEEFCGGPLLQKRAPLDKIRYVGNLGRPGNYGCNMRLVAKDIVGKYYYTANMINAGASCQHCVCDLKIGFDKDGKEDILVGWPQTQVLSFHLAKGETKHITFEPDTQGICGCAAGTVPRWSPGSPKGQASKDGLLSTTCFEFDFANKGNDGNSGIDVSSLVPTDHGFAVQGLQACKGSPCRPNTGNSRICSTLFSKPAGDESLNEGQHAFGKGTHEADGLGPEMQPGPATVQVYVDYQHQEAFDFNRESCES